MSSEPKSELDKEAEEKVVDLLVATIDALNALTRYFDAKTEEIEYRGVDK